VIVAIDGPAGAGKSTVSRALAARLAFGHLDTGAMYRAVALAATAAGIDPSDATSVEQLLQGARLSFAPSPDGLTVSLGDDDVTEAIRAPEISAAASVVARHAGVRSALVAHQRLILSVGDWVADGRDIGSVVCPDAAVKVYLTADPTERARRRFDELGPESLASTTLDHVRVDIERRDHQDTTRLDSPLVVADGAAVIDSTGRTVDDVVSEIAQLVEDQR
jgi:CMP/dCMP kinase